MKPHSSTKQPEITLISPEGKPVRTSEYFECPAEIIIGHNGVAFDGWVVRTDMDFLESDLRWLEHQLEIIRDTQGAERVEVLAAALERLISTPGCTNAGESWPEGRGELPDAGHVPTPFCISPDGSPVNAVEELPVLPPPKEISIREPFLLVDGWNFRIWPITKPHMEWLARQACRWREEDPSPENAAQINVIVHTIETMLKDSKATSAVPQLMSVSGDPAIKRGYTGTCTNVTCGVTARMYLTMSEQDGTLSGNLDIYDELGGGGPITGTMDDARVEFTTVWEFGKIEWLGRIIGKTICGTYLVEGPDGLTQGGTWTASRSR